MEAGKSYAEEEEGELNRKNIGTNDWMGKQANGMMRRQRSRKH